MIKTLFTHWRSHLLPAPAALALVSVTGAFLGMGLACSALYGISAAENFADGLGRFAFLFGFITMPLAALLLLGAAIRESRPLPRGLLLGGSALNVLLGGFATSLGIGADSEAPLVTGAATFLFIFTPLVIVLLGVALFFTLKGWGEVRTTITADRERRALEMIEARGEVTLANLAAELGLRVDECDNLVEAALQAGRIAGWHDAARGRVYSAAALRERQARLAAIITAHGQIHLDDLTRELNAPRDLARTWIYELVNRGEFTGYLNWNKGILYSAEARRLTEAGKCPYCNGELALAGKGVIRCGYCGSEIFL